MYLLDTNVISELHRAIKGRGDRNVTAWMGSVGVESCYLSPITLMELEIGVLRMERRDTRQGSVLRKWFEETVVPEFRDRMLPIDAAVARRCAGLHVPDPRSERDSLIAATALVHRMTLVTRNVVDFRPTGVGLLDPWGY